MVAKRDIDVYSILKKVDPSVSWEKFRINIVDNPPYGVVMTAGIPVISYPSKVSHIDDFLISYTESSHLLCPPRIEEFPDILERVKSEPCAIDIETSSLSPYLPGTKIVAFSLSFPDISYSFPTTSPYVSEDLASIFEKFMLDIVINAKYLVLQNGYFDTTYMCHKYPDILHMEDIHFEFDTMIAAHVITGAGLDEYNLGYLAKKYVKGSAAWKGGPSDWLAENISRRDDRTFDKVPAYILLPYSRRDSYYTMQIYLELKRQMDEDPELWKVYRNIHETIGRLCQRMTWDGLWIDKFMIDYLDVTYISKAERAKEEMKRILKERLESLSINDELVKSEAYTAIDNVNIDSPKQVSGILFDLLGLPVLDRSAKTRDPKTGTKELLKLASFDPPVFAPLFTHKKWFKYYGYLKNYVYYAAQKAGQPDAIEALVCHSQFSPIGTKTGRLASRTPNGQNINVGSGLKACFCSPDRASMIDDLYWELKELGMPTHLAEKRFDSDKATPLLDIIEEEENDEEAPDDSLS